ncbi:formate/nitrite transporter family protein [Persicimonas caeni]|uniref:Formate/nitrite transporter family protein n=1 Tax=Persicimonas caeni TaxID=2292766 RepID=A0A4Y6PQS2_PERCE|nr:formate/nitrite transporter family protein [Persicimonas caeni]QDG50590.1 formate/nitrite transporter family protein [Persicimonas caeni]QED31811.1 formate/nitrite transporter family protein [Persicimonas caeni]
MSVAPKPSEIFHRAADEGDRRLGQSMLELVSTSFIAGFTIVFGLVALGIAHSLVKPQWGQVSQLAGALAFAVGLVFLIVGRAELFNENFFDPVATAFEQGELKAGAILRLWGLTFLLNLVGGGLFALVFGVAGVLPKGAASALATLAEEIAGRGVWTVLASAFVGGALVSLLSFMLKGVNSVVGRILMAYLVGFLLAFGPFDHVIVTVLHVFFGILFDAAVDFGDLFRIMGLVTAGNLVGGVGLVTFSHVAQAKGASDDDG